MSKLGFIGYGSVGSMLVNGFLTAGIVNETDVVVATRTHEKLASLSKRWPEVKVREKNIDVAKEAEYIFIGVKPAEVLNVLEEIKPYLREDSHIVCLAVCVTLETLGKVLPGVKITRVIPTLTSEVRIGISLVCHNDSVDKKDIMVINGLFSSISTVKTIGEEDFEAATNFTACGPGVMAALFQEFVAAGMRESNISKKDAEEMVLKTIYGTAKMLFEKNMGFDEIISRVATKGGITEEGVRVIKQEFPNPFDDVFLRTLEKSQTIQGRIEDNHLGS